MSKSRDHLVGEAQRELDALRAQLDVRLTALEGALASPDPDHPLAGLVLDLARTATAEAESAAARATLEAQLDVERRAEAEVSEATRQRDLARAEIAGERAQLRDELAIGPLQPAADL